MIEVIAVSVIVGILAAMAVPSMWKTVERGQVQATADRVKGVFQEAQRAAIKRSKTCTITISSTEVKEDTTTRDDANPCVTDPVTTADTSSQTIAIKTTASSAIADIASGSPVSVTFSYKGTTTNSATFIITRSDIANNSQGKDRKCLVISLGIGIMRTGNWTWDSSGSTGSCTTSL